MSSEADELKKMILNFRVSELQMLLGFAGRIKSGKKNELQQRALDLVRVRSQPVCLKIRELYKSIQQNTALTNSTGVTQAAVAGKDLQNPPSLTPNMPQPQTNIQRVHPFNPAVDQRQMQPGRAAMYNQPSMYQYTAQPYPQKQMIPNNYPVHPDVRLKRLPFFDILADLIKPSTLIGQNTQRLQDAQYQFHLTPAQATDIASNRDLRPDSKLEYVKQVQLRFCLLETTCEQEDNFPPNLAVKVNNKACPLPNPIPTNKPGVDPKRPPRPVNITPLIKLNPAIANTVTVSWGAEYGRGFVISVMLVHKLNSTDLLQRLKQRGIKHSDFTRGLIKEKLSDDGDCEIATTSLRVSLVCPLGKMRMTTPCRATTCQHLQCFDASLFLQMNERKATWHCPVCDKPAVYDHLVIDGYFQEVLASPTLPSDINEVHLHKDGSWSTQIVAKKENPVKPEDLDESVQIIDDDVIPIIPDEKPIVKVSTTSNSDAPPKNTTVVDLTLSDSEEEAPTKRKTPPKPDSTNTFNDTTSVSSTASVVQLGTTSGSSSVSSSGYRSPSVITLDSPSPPTSPPAQQRQNSAQTPTCAPQAQLNPVTRSSCMMNNTTPLVNYPQMQNNSNSNPAPNNISNSLTSMTTNNSNNSNSLPGGEYNHITNALPYLDTNDDANMNSLFNYLNNDDVDSVNNFFNQF